MVTFRQASQSYISYIRAAEREKKSRAKEAARFYREQQKQQELVSVAESVKRYEEYIEALTSVHTNCSEQIDWDQVNNDPEPPIPEQQSVNEIAARKELEEYKFSFLEKIFGAKKKVQAFEKAIERAKTKDKKDFESSKEAYENWQAMQTIAAGVHRKDPQAYADAIEYFDPFSDIKYLGSKLLFHFEADFVEIELYVNSLEVIPSYVLSQTRTGRLSQKDMPKGKFYEMYQDYVCSAVLRVAREMLAYLPVERVIIHAVADMVNSSTGHLEEVTIVSVLAPRQTIDKLNYFALDPSDSMQNFVHNMNFFKTKGFSQVTRVGIK